MPNRYIPKLPREDKLKSALVSTTGALLRTGKSPDEALGDLFAEVQKNKLYDDGKTFVDLVPRGRMKAIQKEFILAKQDPNFDLRDFVSRHFYEFAPKKLGDYQANPHHTVSEHITELWDELERRNRLNRGSLLALPNSYVVPGGRFTEQFYWDSYFIMLGLAASGRWNRIDGMIKNYAYMIRKFGFIPTANRTYFLSRSQPPFFSHMVRLLATHKNRTKTLIEYLPYLLLEYRFWMKGKSKLSKQEHKAFARIVEMPNGLHLNRYYDNKKAPRPESMLEDTETAGGSRRDKERLYLHLRAGAESGWDFSSRWLLDPKDLSTIHTADIVPVDLNCLLYHNEQTIAECYQAMKNPLLAKRYSQAAERRKKAILEYCWDEAAGFFVDYNFHHGESTGHMTLAAVFPLFVGIATKQQADRVAEKLHQEFLLEGGLQTTLINTGQQWDAPNGWAPLQWIAIEGLRRYGHHQLADEIKRRWIKLNIKVYNNSHKLIEKYDVSGNSGLGGGGEYPLQDGFGWTNGVLLALLSENR